MKTVESLIRKACENRDQSPAAVGRRPSRSRTRPSREVRATIHQRYIQNCVLACYRDRRYLSPICRNHDQAAFVLRSMRLSANNQQILAWSSENSQTFCILSRRRTLRQLWNLFQCNCQYSVDGRYHCYASQATRRQLDTYITRRDFHFFSVM